ncbi:unnamed protein product [Trypanosoma congolense IL3000]|uniref:WGS project CAEQ00000000 data, annotated contig 2163 n=1 Tax=Trypanosoma congolense (strain IL3000) TaxID=1068625 RepID=F9WBZ5_TRYCI|nr:unnamed protein product [Trypanosoma congolense IL3000]
MFSFHPCLFFTFCSRRPSCVLFCLWPRAVFISFHSLFFSFLSFGSDIKPLSYTSHRSTQ